MNATLRRKWTVLLVAAAMLFSMLSTVSVSNAAEATDLEWWNFRNNYENNGVTDRPTVDSKEEANMKWGQKYGAGYAAAPTPPIIIDNYLYIATGKNIRKIDRTTGECVQVGGDMASNVGYAMNPIIYADGKFFVQVGNGIIQAVDYETLEPVWSSERIGGQTVSPISYRKIDGVGYLYTGTWGGEKKDGSFFCITTDDNNVVDGIKQHTWKFTPSTDDPNLADSEHKMRGFYWAGAYVTDNYVAVGSDDGTNEGDYTANGVFYTLDPKTGAIIDLIDQIKGDARSSVVYDNGYLYFNTKGGLLYRTAVDETGHLSETSIYNLGGMSTACPVVYNNRLYIGVCGTGGQFDADAGHHFSVIDVSGDLNSDSLIYDIPIKGYPQAGALLTTGNANKDYNGDGNPDGRVYVYFTYNSQPGGIYYLYDEPGRTTLTADQYGELFTPPSGMQQYCISTIIADREGVMYYKNDSGNLMAIERNPAYLENISITTDLDSTPSWSKEFDMGQLEGYTVKVNTDSTVGNITLTLPQGASATVNGTPYSGGTYQVTLSTEGDETPVDVEVTKNGAKRIYKFTIVKQGGNSKLSDLKVTTANSYTGSVQPLNPMFGDEATDYETNYITKLQGSGNYQFASVWPVPADSAATVKVFTGDNAKAGRSDTEKNSDGSMKVTATSGDKKRYAIYFADANKDAKVRVEVTSENGRSTTTYNLTISRTVHVASVALDKNAMEVEIGVDSTLKATVSPSNALDKTVRWSSSDENVATVDETGKVTGIGEGNAVITVTTNDGEFTDTCDVRVIPHVHDINKVGGTSATCTIPGVKEHYVCSKCGKLYSDADGNTEIEAESVIDPAKGHAWSEVSYEWATDNSSVKATRTCGNDSTHVETETVDTVLEEIPVTCETDGMKTWKATFDNEAFQEQTETETITAKGHEWGEVSYVWTEDKSSVTATRICGKDSNHVETETVKTVFEETPVGCETDGVKTWKATFDNEAFLEQTEREVTTAEGHAWGEASYEWAEDYSSVTATRTCGKDPTHVEVEEAETTVIEDTPASCETDGNKVWKATFDNEAFREQTETEIIAAEGHLWGEWVVKTPATETEEGEAVSTCSRNPVHVQKRTIPVIGHVHDLTKVEAKDATCEADGNMEHYICDKGDHPCGKYFSDEDGTNEMTLDEITVPAMDHDWGKPKYTWASNNGSVTAKRICAHDNGNTHPETETVKTTSAVTKKPTTSAMGQTTYTAKFKNSVFETQTKTVTNIPKLVTAPTGKPNILNTIANSAKGTNDVIWDKSKVKNATNYEINWRARGASKWASRTVGNVVRGQTTGLSIGGLYDIRVRPIAMSANGKKAYGTWSNTVYRYFHTTGKIRLASRNKGAFTMSWAKNPAATGYQVMFTTNSNGAGAAKNINTVGASATSFTKRGLKSGTTYYVQVREIKKVGSITYIGNISNPVRVKVK